MSDKELIEVFAICAGDYIEIERGKVIVKRGFLLDLEVHYQCPNCGEDHVSTLPEDQWDQYTIDSTFIDREID